MTRTTSRNRVNKILAENSKGIFSDEYWNHVHKIFNILNNAGFEYILESTKYHHNDSGIPISKEWRFTITLESGKPLEGILTAHGAGSVADPLDRYDISGYVW
jgi:hypothetical protein